MRTTIVAFLIAGSVFARGQINQAILNGSPKGNSSLLNGLVFAFDGREIDARRWDVNRSAVMGIDNQTPQGNAIRTNSSAGYGIWFASTNWIGVDPTATTTVGGHDFTASVDVYHSGGAGSLYGLVGKYGGSGTAQEWWMRVNANGTILLRTFTNSATQVSSLTTGSALPTNTWTRVIVQRTNNIVWCKIGTNATTSTTEASQSGSASGQLTMGRFGTSYLNGGLANFYQWNRAINTNEILTLIGGATYPFRKITEYLRIVTPTDYQVTQRTSATGGVIHVEGIYVSPHPVAVSASWNGGSFATLDAAPASGRFTGNITTTPGEGRLIVQSANGAFDVKNYVGLGDIFIVAGQSNASGRGTNTTPFSTSGMGRLLRNSLVWTNLSDPTDINTDQVDAGGDSAAAGSIWPLLGTRFLTNQTCPIGFLPCAIGGTSVTQWEPGTDHLNIVTLYGTMVRRGIIWPSKCVLWWQGENDVQSGMTQNTYYTNFTNFSAAVVADLGIKVMPFALQDISASTPNGNNWTNINNAIRQAWTNDPNTLPGPDLSSIVADSGDHFHLLSDTTLGAAASNVWVKLKSTFYP